METSFHETKIHGKATFPYIIYRGIIPGYLRGYPLHWHEEMELIHVISGNGIVTVRSTAYQVKALDTVLLPPQTVHSIAQYQDCDMEYFNILFRLSLLNTDPLLEEKYFEPFSRHTRSFPVYAAAGTPLSALLLPHITELYQNRKQPDYELMIKSHLLAILHQLYRHSAPAESRELSAIRAHDQLKKALSCIHAHYADPLSVSQAARLCHFSESYFMKLFKEFTGMSFTQYLLKYRLEVAARRLLEGDEKIIEIAEGVGFHNHSYFTRAFLQAYGMTPSVYRKSALKPHVPL